MPYYQIRDQLFIWNNTCLGRGDRSIIPTALHSSLLTAVHSASHLGIVKLKQKLRQFAYWPGMDRDCEETIVCCVPCQNSDKSFQTTTAPLKPRTYPDGPWLEIGIDIIGPFATAPRGYRYMVVLTDLFSKWPAAHATEDISTKCVCSFLESLFAVWGIPVSLTSDNGPQFTSAEFTSFFSTRNIRHVKTPVYHPQANGATERLNRTIKQLLQSNLLAGKQWKEALQDVLVAIRSTPHSTTGHSPFFLMTGREMREVWSTLQLTLILPLCVSTLKRNSQP